MKRIIVWAKTHVKILIISAVSLAVFTAAGLGIYFAVRPDSQGDIPQATGEGSPTNEAVSDSAQGGSTKPEEENKKDKNSGSKNKKKKDSEAAAESTAEPAAPQEPKIIPLDITSEGAAATLKFKSAKLKYDKGIINLFFDIEVKTEGESAGTDEAEKVAALRPDKERTSCMDQKGNKLKTGSFVTTSKIGGFSFSGITDFSALSQLSLTYAFEGFDPVTVKIDIAV